MTIFPFTFLFNVPGLSNPFTSSAPAAPAFPSATVTETSGRHIPIPSSSQSDTRSLKRARNLERTTAETGTKDACPPPIPLYRRHPSPSDSPPAPLVRKRGWQPSTFEPSRNTINQNPNSRLFGVEQEHMSTTCDKSNDEDVELDLPPSKRRKGIAESVISTAFNAALVGAAVGLTMLRLWKERSGEPDSPPPPPYQEEWANPTTVTTTQPETPSQPNHLPLQKAHSLPSHKRGGSTRSRPRVARKTVQIRRENDSSSQKSPRHYQDVFTSHSTVTGSENGVLDEMDWIGGRLAQLIEEGKRALGTEIVVASESPEDAVDDGSGNWVEEEDSPEFSLSTVRRAKSVGSSRRFHRKSANNVTSSVSPRFSPSLHSRRYCSDDLIAEVSPTHRSSCTGSPSLLTKAYESESPSIRESMERARSAYLQKRGLGLNVIGTGL